MDKLRALEYFQRAAQAGSFASAARSLDVSSPAVTQMVKSLEQSLGFALFYRTSRGLKLTADGERYHEVVRRTTGDLREIESMLGSRGNPTPRGTLAVGMNSSLGANPVMPHLPRFLARYPEVELQLTAINAVQDIDRQRLDLALLVGWPPEGEFVSRRIAQTRLMVCAAPAYWSRHGIPREPEHLTTHGCLVVRSSGGTLLDRWSFERAGERRVVDVKTRVLSDDREWLAESACAGAGVVRLTDLVLARHVASGRLVPALTEWHALEAPWVFVAYRRQLRQSKAARAFLDFLDEAFAELRSASAPLVPRPEWFGRTDGRQSAYAIRKTPRKRAKP